MTDKNTDLVKSLINLLAPFGILIGGDVNSELLKDVDIDLVASKLIAMREKDPSLLVADAKLVKSILEEEKKETKKEINAVEVIRPAEFKPIAAEMNANYVIEAKEQMRVEGSTTDFVNYFNSRLEKLKKILLQHKQGYYPLQSLEALKNLGSGREVCVAGIVKTKFTTKKGNLLLEIEDNTDSAKIIFMNGTSDQSKKLFDSASTIIPDEVLAVKGKYSDPFIMANEIIWPDIPLKERKPIKEDLAIAFISDIHVGSKVFLENNFLHFLEWISGRIDNNRELAGKIKYLIVGGDTADGIGVYPNQEKDLAILDMYEQYKKLFSYFELLPDYIQIFVLPGNHDSVQRAEPQPAFGKDLLKDFKKPNMHMVPNPSYLTLSGVDVLTYHGTSLDSIIHTIPGLSYSKPEQVMIELLKRRHLSPIYGGNIIVPSKEDNLVINKVPDILHMGHIHKNGLANYHNVHIVNSGTWQDRTEFQIKQGHMPSPAILPVYEMKYDRFSNVSFR